MVAGAENGNWCDAVYGCWCLLAGWAGASCYHMPSRTTTRTSRPRQAATARTCCRTWLSTTVLSQPSLPLRADFTVKLYLLSFQALSRSFPVFQFDSPWKQPSIEIRLFLSNMISNCIASLDASDVQLQFKYLKCSEQYLICFRWVKFTRRKYR